MQPYEPRPIRFHGVRQIDGWRLKQYSIVYGAANVEWKDFEPPDEVPPRRASTAAAR